MRPKYIALDHNLQKNMSQLTLNTGKRGRGVASTSASAVTALSNSTDLASLFECPVCFDYVLPPILQCQSGHLVCSICRPKLTCCPTCRGPLGNIISIYNKKLSIFLFKREIIHVEDYFNYCVVK